MGSTRRRDWSTFQTIMQTRDVDRGSNVILVEDTSSVGSTGALTRHHGSCLLGENTTLTRDVSIHQNLIDNPEWWTTDDPLGEHVDTVSTKHDNHHNHEGQRCPTPAVFFNGTTARGVVIVNRGVHRNNGFEAARTDHRLMSWPRTGQHLPSQRRYNEYCVTVKCNRCGLMIRSDGSWTLLLFFMIWARLVSKQPCNGGHETASQPSWYSIEIPRVSTQDFHACFLAFRTCTRRLVLDVATSS